MNETHDLIALVLDKSGSMTGDWSETTRAVKSFLQEQANVPGRTSTFYFVTFNDRVDIVFENRTTTEDIAFPRPGGGTALLDAIGITIDRVGRKLALLPESERPANVYVVVMTDGYENASRLYRISKINEMIKHQETVYNWQFIFLGAGLDSVSVGESLGFNMARSAIYGTDNYAGAYANVSGNISASRQVGGQSISFTEADRTALR